MNLRKTFRGVGQPTNVVYLIAHAALGIGGFTLYRTNGGLLMAVGSSMIAAGLTGWVVFAYVLLTRETADRLKMFERFGLVYAFEARGARIKSEYDERCEKAKSNIDIMGFGLKNLREDCLKDFPRWLKHAQIRVLLLDPFYPHEGACYSDQRDIEESNSSGSIREDVKKFLETTSDLTGEKFEVRLYRCLPSINIFRVDNELFWGPCLINNQSRNTPTFLVRKTAPE